MWLQTALSLLVVLALIGLCSRCLRFLRGREGGQNPPRIRVLESANLGDKRQLLLVAVDDRLVVIGSTPSGISALMQLPPETEGPQSKPRLVQRDTEIRARPIRHEMEAGG